MSTTEYGAEAGDRNLFADLPDESPRTREESIFTIIEHGRPAPLVFSPAPPRQQERGSRFKRLIKRGDSLAIAGVVIVYAVVVWMTFVIVFAQRDARHSAAAATEASVETSASPAVTGAK